MKDKFRTKLEDLIRGCQKENGSSTPDFILAEYIINCLNSFDNAVKARDDWHGHCTDREFDYSEPKKELKIDEAIKQIDSAIEKCDELIGIANAGEVVFVSLEGCKECGSKIRLRSNDRILHHTNCSQTIK